MSKFTFHEVVIGIIVGDVAEGAEFTTEDGAKVVYKDGALSWVTSGGYVGSPLGVTAENLQETFTQITTKVKELSFHEAMQYVAEGELVHVDVEGRSYELRSLGDVDTIIERKEYFKDFYKADFTVEVEQAVDLPFSDISVGVPTPVAEPVGRKMEIGDAYNVHHLYHFAKQSVAQIAEKYNVSERMIYYILDGTHWKAVHEDFHTDFDVVQEDYNK